MGLGLELPETAGPLTKRPLLFAVSQLLTPFMALPALFLLLGSRSRLSGTPATGDLRIWATAGLKAVYEYRSIGPAGGLGVGMGPVRGLRFGYSGGRERMEAVRGHG